MRLGTLVQVLDHCDDGSIDSGWGCRRRRPEHEAYRRARYEYCLCWVDCCWLACVAFEECFLSWFRFHEVALSISKSGGFKRCEAYQVR